MRPILYETNETAFTSFGLGVLDAIECTVEEERNGEYELFMRAPLSGQHVSEISVGRIIVAKPNRTDGNQPFRVYNTSKTIDGIIEVYARHISYDLSGRVLAEGVRNDCGSALTYIHSLCPDFTFTTDRSAQAGTFSTKSPASARAWLGGRAGSILDLYGPGEWHFDMYNCDFLTARGADRGVVIRYGKNLTALEADVDSSNVASKVQCVYEDTNGNVVRGTAVNTGQTAISRILLVDVTDKYDYVPSVLELTTQATAYIASHNVKTPKTSITFDWVQSGDIIDRVDLCDTVTVVYEDLGVQGSAKCIRTKWDVLEERYKEIEIGDVRNTLADTLVSYDAKIETAVEETASAYQQAIEAASNIITGAAGGYVVFWNSTTQAPGTTADPANEILVMDTPNISTATKVWRWNINGLGYSSNGYAGTYQTAIDMNGGIATWFIDTVRLNADNITAGTLTGRVINNGSGTFYVDANGNLTAAAATISGGSITGSLAFSGSITATNLSGDSIKITPQTFMNTALTGDFSQLFPRSVTFQKSDATFYGYLQASQYDSFMELYAPAGLRLVSPSVTMGSHTSAVGSIVSEVVTTNFSLAAQSGAASHILDINIPAGAWVILGSIRFAAVSSEAYQVLTISTQSGHYLSAWRSDLVTMPNKDSQLQCVAVVNISAQKNYNLNASTTVTATVAATATFIKAIRIF